MGSSDFGKSLVAGVAAFTAVGGYLADWNRTHLYNPNWPPHAKFHDAQTILLGSLLGGTSLLLLRRGPGDARTRLRLAALLPGLYWLSQAGSILFPNTAFHDPEFEQKIPKIGGVRVNQAMVAGVMLGLLGLGCRQSRAEERRLARVRGTRGASA